MFTLLFKVLKIIRSKFHITSNLVAQNLVLRQQLSIMQRRNKRPKLKTIDRVFWILLSRFWKPWRKSLIIFKPETVISWHRKGFRLFWKHKSRSIGRPRVNSEIRDLIRKMARANPSWGAPRIHGELLRLGFEISERTVSKLMPRRPPNARLAQSWRTFLNNHAHKYSIDFFVVPTVTFKILFVFIVLRHSNREIVHFNMTSNPTA